jgi:hypothetical protein
VPRESQLSPDAGQIYFSTAVLPSITQAVPKPNLAACIATCPPDSCCMVQFNGNTGTCYYATAAWDPAGVWMVTILAEPLNSTLRFGVYSYG